jgi:hemolysin activation/secretion protein
MGGGAQGARLYGIWRQRIGGPAGATLRFKGGLATDPVPVQLAWRVGGQATVRGFDYGVQRGDAFWAVQSDWTLSTRAVRPVLFVDAGQATVRRAPGSPPVLVGGGVGLSALNGLLRLDLSHPVTPRPAGSGLRLDLIFGAAR